MSVEIKECSKGHSTLYQCSTYMISMDSKFKVGDYIAYKNKASQFYNSLYDGDKIVLEIYKNGTYFVQDLDSNGLFDELSEDKIHKEYKKIG